MPQPVQHQRLGAGAPHAGERGQLVERGAVGVETQRREDGRSRAALRRERGGECAHQEEERHQRPGLQEQAAARRGQAVVAPSPGGSWRSQWSHRSRGSLAPVRGRVCSPPLSASNRSRMPWIAHATSLAGWPTTAGG